MISYCLPVYSTFIERSSLGLFLIGAQTTGQPCVDLLGTGSWLPADAGTALPFTLLLYSSLVSAGDSHVFAVFRYRAARDLDALRLQECG